MYSIKGLGQSYRGDDVTVFSGAQQPVEVFSGGAPVEVFADFAAAIDSYEASMEIIGELQCALSQKGINPGPLDGLWGTQTQKGLAAFAKSIDQTAMAATTMAELGLDLGEVEAAKQYQADHKSERPTAYMPSAAMQCGGIFDVPGAAAAATGGFLKRNWKWLAAAGVLTVGAVGIGAWVALRKKSDEEDEMLPGRELGAIMAEGNPGYLYGNQYLQQTYGLRGRGRGRGMGQMPSRRQMGTVMPRRGRRSMGRGRRGLGLITTDSVFTYQNPWLQQIYK
jgi:hypothetical protein